MRTTGLIALAGGVLLLGAIMAITLLDSGGTNATSEQQGVRLLIQTPVATQTSEAQDDADQGPSLLLAMSELLRNAQANDADADSDTAPVTPDDNGCVTEIERGNGWERTVTICSQQQVERNGNNISISNSSSSSVSTQSTD